MFTSHKSLLLLPLGLPQNYVNCTNQRSVQEMQAEIEAIAEEITYSKCHLRCPP
jgi:hypothetical protein